MKNYATLSALNERYYINSVASCGFSITSLIDKYRPTTPDEVAILIKSHTA